MTYTLPLVLGLIALASLFMGAVWFGKRRSTLRHAGDTYEDWTRECPHALHGLTEEEFRAAFMRAHGARGQATIAIALAAVIVLTPPALGLLRGVWYSLWLAGGRAPYYEEGLLIWQFFMFFALGAVWAGIMAVAARIHHQRAPGSLREEILREAAHKTTGAPARAR